MSEQELPAKEVVTKAVELEAHAHRLLIGYLPNGSKPQVVPQADRNVQLRDVRRLRKRGPMIGDGTERGLEMETSQGSRTEDQFGDAKDVNQSLSSEEALYQVNEYWEALGSLLDAGESAERAGRGRDVLDGTQDESTAGEIDARLILGSGLGFVSDELQQTLFNLPSVTRLTFWGNIQESKELVQGLSVARRDGRWLLPKLWSLKFTWKAAEDQLQLLAMARSRLREARSTNHWGRAAERSQRVVPISRINFTSWTVKIKPEVEVALKNLTRSQKSNQRR